jgi:acyl-CoA reductase-like NAD-dependent aldehyde dehydrogenase
LFDKASAVKAVAAQALAKANRYTKQRRLALKRIKELGRREDQNIFELEMDEMLIDNTAIVEGLEMNELITIITEGVILLRALNSSSPRSFSFFNSALLGFSNRSVKVSQGSS